MKKLLLLATWAVSISAYALPTYEPFTEYSNACVLTGTNAIDLATGGYSAPGGEQWGNLSFSGTFGTGLHGLDIDVTNNAASVFTSSALSALLPASFPGFPSAGQAITTMVVNPAQPLVGGVVSPNIVGNSAVLKFAQPVTRPTNGVKTIFVSYLLSIAQAGQSGTGNNGRYCCFLSSTNLVEGLGSGGAYTNWAAMFNTFNSSVTYVSYGAKTDGAGAVFVGPSDSSGGNNGSVLTLHSAYNTANFVVSAYVFTTGGAIKDTNAFWLNPPTSSFGGPAPSTSQVVLYPMTTVMSDVGGFCLLDRVGSGSAGGIGTNYIANLLIGSTWSYVTGGPEFTVQPGGVNVNLGGNVALNGTAVAAAQNVTYQWQKITATTTNNVTDGSGGAGGAATVSGSTGTALSLTGVSAADLGNYQLLATATGTGFSLASATAIVVSDPTIVSQPQSALANYGAQVAFSAAVTTARASLSYAWYNGSTPLIDGPQSDGSIVSGSSGTVAGGSNTLTLTVSNVSYLNNGSSYSVYVTNNFNNAAFSDPAILTVNDPYIITQPVGQTDVAGATATLTVAAAGSPTLNYQWYQNNNPLSDGSTVAGGGPIFGSVSPSLVISNLTDANAGSYVVQISGGSGQITNSVAVTLVVADPVAITGAPVSRTERVGDHMAFVVGATGGALSYQWQFNGTNISGATKSTLVLANIQTTNQGAYTAIVSNPASTNNLSATLTVINSANLFLAQTNVIVVRVGDGSQALSGATGNTIYLDQYALDGTYVSTVQVPDEAPGKAYPTGGANSVVGSPALLAQGAGADAPYSTMLTVSGGNQEFLSLAGYCQQYPYSGADVTVAAVATAWRGLATVNAFGVYTLAYTNFGLYSGGNHTIRSTVTLDGTNFWTTGQAGSGGGVKFVNSTVFSYATGSGIPALGSSSAGERLVQVVGTNLIFSDAGAGPPGLYAYVGTPEPPNGGTATSTIILNEGGQPSDFAFSPDGQTVYIADTQAYGGNTTQAGGIQRWDTNNNNGWNYSYTLAPINGSTVGAQGLAVYFPSNVTTWGAGATGAVLYATSFGGVSNSLSQIIDNGQDSTATVIAAAGPNQFLQGVRFGPAAVPVTLASQPQSQTNFPGNSVSFSVAANGSLPFFYQWLSNSVPIAGATNATLTISNLQFASAGPYSVTVTNLVPSSATSSNAVLTITAGAPVFTVGVPSFVETVGDHLAFSGTATGTLPLAAQWYFNTTNNPIIGATNLSLSLANIQTTNSGTYLLYVSNTFGNGHSSGTLTVTTSPQMLSSNNLVVARVGDGAQALSGATGNTIYLDQYTTNGAYVNTIQIPDEGTGLPYGTGGSSSASQPFGSPALLVAGGNSDSDAGYEAFLTRSADGQTLNFVGYCEAYPFLGPDLTVGANGGLNWRGIAGVDAFGYYSINYTNTGLYSGGNHQVHAAVTLDQMNYWATGEAGSGGVKYFNTSFQPADGLGIGTITPSSAAGARVVQIINGSVVYSDTTASPNGIYSCFGLVGATSASLLVAEPNSPMDFAISPDGNTIYIADNGVFGGTNVQTGGIQRWDPDPVNGGFAYSYTLATGSGSTVGARGLTVDFSANQTWGAGVTGAKLYATTAELSGNRLISIVDKGPASSATTLITTSSGNTLAGIRFGPSIVPVTIVTDPPSVSAIAGQTTSFGVGVTGSAPYFYQWMFNGTNISGATQSTYTLSPVQLTSAGNYSVLVSNAMPSSAISGSGTLTVSPAPQFASSTYLGAGQGGLQLNFSGPAGQGYTIWTTTNVADRPIETTWTPLTSGATFSGGLDSFTDSNAGVSASQFYIITVP